MSNKYHYKVKLTRKRAHENACASLDRVPVKSAGIMDEDHLGETKSSRASANVTRCVCASGKWMT